MSDIDSISVDGDGGVLLVRLGARRKARLAALAEAHEASLAATVRRAVDRALDDHEEHDAIEATLEAGAA